MTILSDLVVPGHSNRGAAIVLEDGLSSEANSLINSFTPTGSSIAVLRHLQKAVLPTAPRNMRSMIWHGVYGSGKSHLGVLVGDLLTHGVGDSAMTGFLQRLENLGEGTLRREIDSTFHPATDPDARPYLIVPLYGSPAPTLQAALIEGLHEALSDVEGLDPSEIMPKTEFAAAKERLVEILSHHPEYRSKPLSDWGIQCAAFDLDELEDQLGKVVPEALEAFKDWHPKASAGARFDPQDYGGRGVSDAYSEAASNLIEQYSYNGIAVIWDEFGYALENLINEPSRNPIDEIFSLQGFVETVCEPNSGHTLFIALTHRSLREYGASTQAGREVKQRLETIEGRFSSLRIELKNSEAEGYHLLSALLSQTPKGRTLLSQAAPRAEALTQVCSRMPLFSSLTHDLPGIVSECYPLHPVTAAGLFAVAAHGVYAQANRTVFTFFDNLDVVRNGAAFDRPVSENALFGQELIRLPALFEVYKKEVFDEYPAMADAYRHAEGVVLDGYPETAASKRDILTLLLLARVLGGHFQSTDSFLAAALYDQEVPPPSLIQDLEILQKAGVIWKRDTDVPVWELEAEGGTQIEPLIDEELAQIPIRTMGDMLSDQGLRADLLPQCGVHDFEPSPAGIIRSFLVDLLGEIGDTKSLAPRDEGLSAQVFFFIPDGDNPAEQALRQCETLEAPGVLTYLWIPRQGFGDLADTLRRYQALSNLMKQQAAGAGVVRRLRAEWNKTRTNLRTSLNDRIGRRALKQGDVVIKRLGDPDEVVDVTSWHGFTEFLDAQVRDLYHKEVTVRTMNANRLYTEDDRKINRVEILLRNILAFDDLQRGLRNDLFGERDTSEIAALIDGTLGVYSNGLLVERPAGWNLKTPDEADGAIGELLQLIQGKIVNKRRGAVDLGDLRKLLIAPPYGLPVAVMPLFTAVAIRKDHTRLKWVGKKTGTFESLLWNAFAAYDDHKLRFDTFKKGQLQVLNAVHRVLSLPPAESEDPDDQARAVVKGLRKYHTELPAAVKGSRRLPQAARTLFETLHRRGQDAQAVADTLLAVVKEAGDDEPDAPLRELFDGVARIKDERGAVLRQTIEHGFQDTDDADRIDATLRTKGDEALADAFQQVRRGEDAGLSRVAECVLKKSLDDCTDIEIGQLSFEIKSILKEAAELPKPGADEPPFPSPIQPAGAVDPDGSSTQPAGTVNPGGSSTQPAGSVDPNGSSTQPTGTVVPGGPSTSGGAYPSQDHPRFDDPSTLEDTFKRELEALLERYRSSLAPERLEVIVAAIIESPSENSSSEPTSLTG